jgi:DNA replicative helicase MCM subunit Mcm2 (Cdc46/Mcm family)
LAKHVTQVHRQRKVIQSEEEIVEAEVMRAFLSHAQNYDPNIPAALHNYIVAKYVEKRKFQREGSDL